MRELGNLFAALSKSGFRSKFHLQGRDRDYLLAKGLPTILDHARDFITKRLASSEPVNDGRQTPFRGHPVFIAQHATACCCRGCLELWHRIPKGRDLTSAEKTYIIGVLERWLKSELDTIDRA